METGGLQTRQARKHQADKEVALQSAAVTPVTSELITPTTPQAPTSIVGEMPSTENLLEQILEEDSSLCDDRTQIVSPNNDTKCLLGNGHTMHSVAITRI